MSEEEKESSSGEKEKMPLYRRLAVIVLILLGIVGLFGAGKDDIALLVFLITIPTMLVGLIKPAWLDFEDRKAVLKYVGIAMVASFFMFVAVMDSEDEKPISSEVKKEDAEKPKEEVNKEEPKKEEPKYTEAHKQMILKFEEEIFAAEEKGAVAFEQFQQTLTALGQGQTSILDAYDSATRAYETSDAIWMSIRNIEIPKDLPRDIRDILEESKDEISTGYFVKTEGLESFLAYLNEQKPADFQKAKDNMQASQSYVFRGVAKLFEAKTKAGIEVVPEEKKE